MRDFKGFFERDVSEATPRLKTFTCDVRTRRQWTGSYWGCIDSRKVREKLCETREIEGQVLCEYSILFIAHIIGMIGIINEAFDHFFHIRP
jgi:hypothetical protein